MDRSYTEGKKGSPYEWDSKVVTKRVDNGTSWFEIDIPREMAALLGGRRGTGSDGHIAHMFFILYYTQYIRQMFFRVISSDHPRTPFPSHLSSAFCTAHITS